MLTWTLLLVLVTGQHYAVGVSDAACTAVVEALHRGDRIVVEIVTGRYVQARSAVCVPPCPEEDEPRKGAGS